MIFGLRYSMQRGAIRNAIISMVPLQKLLLLFWGLFGVISIGSLVLLNLLNVLFLRIFRRKLLICEFAPCVVLCLSLKSTWRSACPLLRRAHSSARDRAHKTDRRADPGADAIGTQIPFYDGSTDLEIECPGLGSFGKILAGCNFVESIELQELRRDSAETTHACGGLSRDGVLTSSNSLSEGFEVSFRESWTAVLNAADSDVILNRYGIALQGGGSSTTRTMIWKALNGSLVEMYPSLSARRNSVGATSGVTGFNLIGLNSSRCLSLLLPIKLLKYSL